MEQKDKLDRIRVLTGFSLEAIKKMTDIQFFQAITRLLSRGTLTKEQHDWLNKQRTDKDIQQIIDIFGGHEVR
jgi:hypothetical protein